MNFLDKVLPVKQAEVKELKEKMDNNRFARLFQKSRKEIILIAEVKPKSPSVGQLITGNPLLLIEGYEKGGADAISVLTDSQFFGGGSELFANIRIKTNLPLLRKEFIIDESQLVESVALGADAVLLIVQMVSTKKLEELIHFAERIGLVPLVEVISEAELKVAIESGAKYIGVNSRDLRTMDVDKENALLVLNKIPKNIHAFLFSGIENSDQVEAAAQAGASGVLIGTSLIKSSNSAAKIKELRATTKE
jgi:indole-3-glycerol phosphate synthase